MPIEPKLNAEPPVARILAGAALTTAEIIYRMPDHPALLQTFIWQDYDFDPDFPALRRFLDFWRHELEGSLHSVKVMSNRLIQPAQFRHAACRFQIH